MTTPLTYLLLIVVLITPFAVLGLIARQPHREGHLRFRLGHDLDAVRTRFEEHPSWPHPGVLGERR